MPTILVTNDDGVHSPGLLALKTDDKAIANGYVRVTSIDLTNQRFLQALQHWNL